MSNAETNGLINPMKNAEGLALTSAMFLWAEASSADTGALTRFSTATPNTPKGIEAMANPGGSVRYSCPSRPPRGIGFEVSLLVQVVTIIRKRGLPGRNDVDHEVVVEKIVSCADTLEGQHVEAQEDHENQQALGLSIQFRRISLSFSSDHNPSDPDLSPDHEPLHPSYPSTPTSRTHRGVPSLEHSSPARSRSLRAPNNSKGGNPLG